MLMNEEGWICNAYCVALSNWPLNLKRVNISKEKKYHTGITVSMFYLVPKTVSMAKMLKKRLIV